MILLLGCKGSMGRRYEAILKHLHVPYVGHDINDNGTFSKEDIKGIIIATPTETHNELIKKYASWQVPILCEKPVTKVDHELEEILTLCRKKKVNLQMVNQYKFMPLGKDRLKKTKYDYFRHGNDGLHWDCINIIGLSKSKRITLSDQSPVWSCTIDGKRLQLSQMDGAYVKMIQHWLRSPRENLNYIEKAHKKVRDFRFEERKS